jgi:hypothetical protein
MGPKKFIFETFYAKVVYFGPRNRFGEKLDFRKMAKKLTDFEKKKIKMIGCAYLNWAHKNRLNTYKLHEYRKCSFFIKS